MLVTRQCDIGRNTWSPSKLEAIYQNAASSRMSNFGPPPTQPDWREQYSSFPLPGETGLVQPPFEQPTSLNVFDGNQSQQQVNGAPQLEQRHSLGPIRKDPQPPAIIEQPDSVPIDGGNQLNNSIRNASLASIESTALSLDSLGSSPLSSTSAAPPQQGTIANNKGIESNVEPKDEEDDEEGDDEMVDSGEGGTAPQTAAERQAERRKMKRFRLTHQQTRFLMSEFAKQAHPDAAHRERLSREIPGLSPRQVQVWFQNRRAKTKRLTADDRERIIKMRAVPDGFDNVQALHSPYGAVHGIGATMQSPVDFVPQYTDHMMRPLIVDTMRRNEQEEHISPTGLSPAFGHVGFSPGGPMGSSDVHSSPLALNSTDRYYPSHLSNPRSAGPRSSNPFDRQNSYQTLSHSRQHARPLQPLQIRDTMQRSRSESIQSPLRSSMSWKGETLGYAHYQTGQPSPQLSKQPQSAYQPDQSGTTTVIVNQNDGNTYSNANVQGSPTHMTYSPAQGPSALQQSSPSAMSRLRNSSSEFPSGLDLRNQYRIFPPQHNSSHGVPPTPRSGSFSSTFADGYACTPLTVPVGYSLPRTPVDGGQESRDVNIPQLGAPMAPPQDFQNIYTSTLSPARVQQGDRDFGNRGQNIQDPASQGRVHPGDQQQQQARNNEDVSYLRPIEYESGQERRRSFAMPGTFEHP